MSNGESRLIFEIEGVPLRKLFGLKKHRSYIAVYDDQIHVILKGEEHRVQLNNIFDVFFKEPATWRTTSRTTEIYFYENGKTNTLNLLTDETFDGLSEKMEKVLQNEWVRSMEKRKYPDTIRWFIACNAVVSVSSGTNPYLYGLSFNNDETVADQRKELKRSWGFTQRSDLLDMLPSLYSGRAIANYFADLENMSNLKDKKRKLMERIKNTCGDNGIWAWDLQRLIWLCNLGYISGYLSYEESLDLALTAAKKLQSIYKSWDDFMNSYVLGYCYWSNDDIEDECSEAYARAKTYEYYKNRDDSPWNVDWNCPLSVEWEPSGILLSDYISVVKTETHIAVLLDCEHEITDAIGKKMSEINTVINMNGYNWAVFFNYYLSKYTPDVMQEMETEPDADIFAAVYPLTSEGVERIERLVGIIRNLVSNEEEIYRIVRENGHEIEWA